MSETSSTESAKVTVQRSPRYLRFFFVGVSLGVIVALILTVAFPTDPQFSQTQVFGFLVIFTGAGGAVLGLVFALVVDRVYSRHVIETSAERTSVNEAPAADVSAPATPAAPASPTTPEV
jgi:hypothetical protein